jgi:hypothetical protein
MHAFIQDLIGDRPAESHMRERSWSGFPHLALPPFMRPDDSPIGPLRGPYTGSATMQLARSIPAAVLALALASSGLALAQTPPASTSPPASSSPSTTAEDVSNWTKKKWAEMKAKWAKEKVKYADCRKQAKDQKLTGTKGWSFTADCMSK